MPSTRLRYALAVTILTVAVGIWTVMGLRFGGEAIESDLQKTRPTNTPTTTLPTKNNNKSSECVVRKGMKMISCSSGNHLFEMSHSTCDIESMESGEIKTMESLHHGIYKVVTTSGAKFAIKPECRPAAKWHGQQGWTEIALVHLSRALLGKSSTVPCAKGVELSLSDEFQKIIHSDRCGLLSNPGTPKPFLGVALEWTAHKEEALNLIKKHFKVLFGNPSDIPDNKKDHLKDVSDVLILDYVTINPDRKDKNWFYNNDKTRVIAMDNGWGYAGEGYQGSVCDVKMSGYLECPPAIQFVAKDCKKNGLQFCAFRRETVDRLRAFVGIWTSGLSDFWIDVLLSDLQINYLLENYNTWDSRAPSHPKLGNRLYSVALGRFVHTCPGAPTSHTQPSVSSRKLLSWVSLGVQKRIETLLRHIDQCIESHGASAVLL